MRPHGLLRGVSGPCVRGRVRRELLNELPVRGAGCLWERLEDWWCRVDMGGNAQEARSVQTVCNQAQGPPCGVDGTRKRGGGGAGSRRWYWRRKSRSGMNEWRLLGEPLGAERGTTRVPGMGGVLRVHAGEEEGSQGEVAARRTKSARVRSEQPGSGG